MLANLKQNLVKHLSMKPQRPKSSALIFRNTSPQALEWRLHTGNRSAGLVSDEGAQILNGRATGQLATLNELWGGGDLIVDRRTTESFTVKGGRLTLSVMVQEKEFEKFLSGQGALARDNGFLARCLVNDPLSTQGAREDWSIEEPIKAALRAFQKRITEILEMSQAGDGTTKLEKSLLTFSPDAKVRWVDFSNHIERNLGPGGAYAEVRDAASKTAENVARMAALFHFFEGRSGDILVDSVDQALQICEWHLNEFKRIFGTKPETPVEQLDAQLLEFWLWEVFKKSGACHPIRKTYVRQYCVNSLRSKNRLNTALWELARMNKLTFGMMGKTEIVLPNPNYFLIQSHPNQQYNLQTLGSWQSKV